MGEQDEPNQASTGTDLPLWFRVTVVSILVVLLVSNVLLDIIVSDYEGQATSLMLGGIIGTTLGVDKLLRGRGDS